jgi:hypothetical protein
VVTAGDAASKDVRLKFPPYVVHDAVAVAVAGAVVDADDGGAVDVAGADDGVVEPWVAPQEAVRTARARTEHRRTMGRVCLPGVDHTADAL